MKRAKRKTSKSKSAAPIDENAILAAAIKLFRSKGYHATSMQDIADEVGLLKGSLYHHIDSKESLMLAVLRRSVRDVSAAVETAVAGQATARMKLRAAIAAEIEAMAKHQDEILIWVSERGRLPSGFAKIEVEAKAVDDILFKIVQQGVKEKIWVNNSHSVVTRAVLGMIISFPAWYRAGGPLSAQEIAEQFYQLADRMLSTDMRAGAA